MQTKICYTCKQNKSIDEFSINKTKKDGRQSQCRECHKVYCKKDYLKNKVLVKKRIFNRKKEIKLWIWNLKSKLKCINCPETDPRCLDFHHRDASQKVLDVSIMVSLGCSKERILEEIKKCDAICSNCHRKLTIKMVVDKGLAPMSPASEAGILNY